MLILKEANEALVPIMLLPITPPEVVGVEDDEATAVGHTRVALSHRVPSPFPRLEEFWSKPWHTLRSCGGRVERSVGKAARTSSNAALDAKRELLLLGAVLSVLKLWWWLQGP